MSDQQGQGPERYADDARRYRLDSRIATGGMGEVWRAEDTTLGRTVAVKLLKAEYADDATFRSRFSSEAQHAAALHHPGVAAVFDFGEAQHAATAGAGGHEGSPQPFLVMELVDGEPLSALIRPGQPIDPDVTRDLMAQAADAIGAAHAAGIIHRDVKPANLLVTPDRRVKITDFGIARAAEGMALTQTGQVMGTPQYLSPEQARGNQATPASDVYSLGVVAFECLTSRRPFVGETPVATALAHLREPIPPLPEEVPADLATVVTRSLAKEPEDRFADGAAFAAALRDPAAAVAAAPVAAPLPATETQVLPAAAAGGAAAAAVATPAATPVPPPDAHRRGGIPWPWVLLGVLALVAIVIVAILIATAGDDEQEPDEPQRPQQSRTSEASPTQEQTTQETEPTPTETTTEAETFSIDEGDYVGRDINDVQAELKGLGLKVSKSKLENDGTHEENSVASVSPTSDLQEGDTVTVEYYGKPAPDVVEPTETASETTTESSAPADTQADADGATSSPTSQSSPTTTEEESP